MDARVLATELALMAAKADVKDAMDVLGALEIAPIHVRITAPKAAGIRALDHVRAAQAVQEIATEVAFNHATEHVLTPAQIRALGHAQPTAKEIVRDVPPPVKQVALETVPMIV